MKYGVPFSNEPFPPLVEYPNFYGIYEATPIVLGDPLPEYTSAAVSRCTSLQNLASFLSQPSKTLLEKACFVLGCQILA